MKSTVTFRDFFKKFLKEDITSGALVDSAVVADIYDPNNPVSGDKYNPKDARLAKGGKFILSRKGKVKTRKNRKK